MPSLHLFTINEVKARGKLVVGLKSIFGARVRRGQSGAQVKLKWTVSSLSFLPSSKSLLVLYQGDTQCLGHEDFSLHVVFGYACPT